MNRQWALLALLAGLLVAGPCLTRAQEKEKEKGAPEASSQITPDGFVIGAEDVLAINVWKEGEVSRTVTVRPDGMITLPLVNDVKAAGLTPMQLAALLTEKLRKHFKDPEVTVIVNAINSRKIHLVGEVNRAGTFPMLPDMTVLQALSGAGGFTQYAKTKKIYILRLENGKQLKIPFNYNEVIQGKKPEQNLILKPGDTVVVP